METNSQLERRVLVVLITVVTMAVLSGTMVNVALPVVGQHFAVTEGVYGWLVTGYAITFGLFSAVHGRLADNIGTRRLYVIGLATYSLIAIIIGACNSIEWMIGLRIVQGAGAAAMPALGTLIISRVFPESRRGWALGFILGVVGMAATVGPFVGGILAERISWRAVFWFPGISLFLIPFVWRTLPEELDRLNPTPMDWLGVVLLGGFVSTSLYLPQSLRVHGSSWPTLVSICTAMLCLILFVIRTKTTEHPFVPPQLMRIGRFAASVVCAFLAQATRFGTLVLIPILLVEIHEISPSIVGLALSPGAIAVAYLAPKMGAMSDQVGTQRPVTLGLCAMMMGNLITVLGCGWSTPIVVVGITLYGVGFAGIQSPLPNGVSKSIPAHHLGVGMGLFMTIFFLGGAFGVALSITAVEWQSTNALSWLRLDLAEGGRYSNAILCLTMVGACAFLLVPSLPGNESSKIKD